MKLLFSIFMSGCITLLAHAEPSRSPAVIGGECDLDIETFKIQEGSKKIFLNSINHKVIIHSDDESGCSKLPFKRYPVSLYEENANNEINILFQKYAQSYSKKCMEYFFNLGFKKSEFECDRPLVSSMTFADYKCERQKEAETKRVSYISSATAIVKYKQAGWSFVEKSVAEVQKEQCLRINECMERATAREMNELKKLSKVACSAELTPVSTANAPTIPRDDGYDGNRKAKSHSIKNDQQKTPEAAGSMIK